MSDTSSSGDPSPPNDTASPLMKWLIPSAAILFAATGYIVQAGEESLLGVATSDRANDAYINTAADFVRDTVVRLLNWPFTFFHHPLLHHPFLLPFSAIVVGGAIVALAGGKLDKGYSRSTIVSGATVAVALIVVLKFLMMDAPLLRIQNLVSSENSCWSLQAQKPTQPGQKPVNCRQVSEAKGLVDRWIWWEAGEVAGEIVCSRVSGITAAYLQPLIANSTACQRKADRDTNSSQVLEENGGALADEFLCNLLLELITIAGAIVLMRNAGHSRAAIVIGLLTIVYGVSAPYAYGKVGVTPLLNFGDARISEDLQVSYWQEDHSLVRPPDEELRKSNDPGYLPKHGWVHGALLLKDDSGVSLLTIRSWSCPNGGFSYQSRSSLSFIPQSQLLSFDEISKDDLIKWLIQNQSKC